MQLESARTRTTKNDADTNLSHNANLRQNNDSLAMVYMITPTYARWTQKADLTRLCQTLMHVPRLHWIVIEDSVEKTRLVSKFLSRCKVGSTHLNIRTAEYLRLKNNEPVWRKNRGVEQRNLGIDWLRQSAVAGKLPGGSKRGVVYFGDDDNTYDIELFEEVCVRFSRLSHLCVNVTPMKWTNGSCY